jgi:DNA-binding NarL/FixJ family response regulator
VGSASEAAAVLMAVARGVAVVVDLRLDGPAADQFLDDLSRIADVREDLDVDVDVALDPEHEELLDALVAGLTLTAAADRLGWSRRTATRRLRDARERLGATSTVEALQMHRRRRHDQR